MPLVHSDHYQSIPIPFLSNRHTGAVAWLLTL